MANWTNQPKNSADFTNQNVISTTIDSGLAFLLNELAGYILQENGGRIILSQSTNYKKPITWVNQPKS